jgi:hypothetical protein
VEYFQLVSSLICFLFTEQLSIAFEEAVASKNPVFVYCAAKELSERVIWENKERKFHVTSICPRQ